MDTVPEDTLILDRVRELASTMVQFNKDCNHLKDQPVEEIQKRINSINETINEIQTIHSPSTLSILESGLDNNPNQHLCISLIDLIIQMCHRILKDTEKNKSLLQKICISKVLNELGDTV